MAVCRKGLAIGTEIRVVADCTLVAITDDVTIFVFTQWTIAVYTIVALAARGWVGDAFVDRNKTMTRMVTVGRFHTA